VYQYQVVVLDLVWDGQLVEVYLLLQWVVHLQGYRDQ
jgi:hypothetical protein